MGQNVPHVLVVEAGKRGREIKEKECTQRVFCHTATDGLIHVYDIGGNKTTGEEAALLKSTKALSEGRQNVVKG